MVVYPPEMVVNERCESGRDSGTNGYHPVEVEARERRAEDG
jgi:hypothetical protein